MTDDTQAASSRDSNKEEDAETDREQPRVLPNQSINSHLRRLVCTEQTLIHQAQFGPEIPVLQGGMIRRRLGLVRTPVPQPKYGNLVVSSLEDESQRARLRLGQGQLSEGRTSANRATV